MQTYLSFFEGPEEATWFIKFSLWQFSNTDTPVFAVLTMLKTCIKVRETFETRLANYMNSTHESATRINTVST